MISNMVIINNKYETKIFYEGKRPYIEKPDKSKLFLDKLTVEKLELHEIHTIQLGIVTFENESKVNKN